MRLLSQAEVDELFILAQLCAASHEEAVEWTKKAVSQLEADPTLDATQVLLSYTTTNPGNDMLSQSRRNRELSTLIPEVFTGLSPHRRLAVRKAFLSATGESHERTTFRYLLKRKIEKSTLRFPDHELRDETIADVLRSHLNATLSGTPLSLRVKDDLEQKSETSSKGHTKSRHLGGKIAGTLLLILIASAIGTWITRPAQQAAPHGSRDFIGLLDSQEIDQPLAFTGSDSEQIERLIVERTGIDAQLPSIEGFVLRGLSWIPVFPDVTLPMLHYSDGESTARLFVFSYQMLHQGDHRLIVDPQTLNQIAGLDGLDIHEFKSGSRLVFRHRDDIYVTYTEQNPIEFRNVIRFN